MATWTWYGGGKGPQYTQPHACAFQANIDVPTLISDGTNAGLADTSNNQTALASTGFAAADIFQVFEVPAGFVLRMVGVRVTTVEGAAATGDIGNASATQTHRLSAAADGYMGTLNFNTATTQITLIADTHLGGSTYEAVVFITDGTIDLTINTAIDTCIFDIFAHGFTAW